mmetsp:Transcript_30044/g.22300  ORF Transcript_30044/g.22300 Transcript_30044/m.22300 type:complete len:82 (-) Transcript_30044:718-963(-)
MHARKVITRSVMSYILASFLLRKANLRIIISPLIVREERLVFTFLSIDVLLNCGFQSFIHIALSLSLLLVWNISDFNHFQR